MTIIHPGKGDRLSSEIGSRLKKLLMEKGLTQKELASKVKGGLDYTYIGKIERGQQLPSLRALQGKTRRFQYRSALSSGMSLMPWYM
jgi:transcriptional regulator with XRE-family HTH domain